MWLTRFSIEHVDSLILGKKGAPTQAATVGIRILFIFLEERDKQLFGLQMSVLSIFWNREQHHVNAQIRLRLAHSSSIVQLR